MFTDNGTEFTFESFQRLLVLNKIKHEQSVPYSSYQNGTAKCSWQTLFSMAEYLLIESKLPKNLWASAYIRNRCYDRNTRKKPIFTGSKLNLNKMHIFGTTCFSDVQNEI